jgi:geranylgeranyl diphosphate synthase type II
MILLSCQACGGNDMQAMPAAAAMEMIHTYSLIHDDLPAMDDDDLRRGIPTNHKVFGDGIAILAGDALLTYAFQAIARHIPDPSLVKKLVLELATAAGAAGMIGGQVADIQNQDHPGNLDTVNYIHTHKTAMLFRAAARMGAICADTDSQTLEILGDYGLKLGLAFQIVDDLLDLTSTPAQMGKQTQKDSDAGKLTYPSVIGQQDSHNHAENLFNQALNAITPLGPSAESLRLLALMIKSRKN